MTEMTLEQALKERAEARGAVHDMLAVLWNIQAIADLMHRVPEIHCTDFRAGDEIAGGIRVIQDIAMRTAAKFGGIP